MIEVGKPSFAMVMVYTFIAQKSQLQAFIDQINASSRCATQGCEGLLKPVCVNMIGSVAID